MGRVSHSWREPWASALAESDPSKLLGRIEYAIAALERRYAEWESNPGTPAELKAIQKAIFSLERLMKQDLGRHGAVPPGATWRISDATEPNRATNSVRSDASSLFCDLDLRCSEGLDF
jgi:hypothetical protein